MIRPEVSACSATETALARCQGDTVRLEAGGQVVHFLSSLAEVLRGLDIDTRVIRSAERFCSASARGTGARVGEMSAAGSRQWMVRNGR